MLNIPLIRLIPSFKALKRLKHSCIINLKEVLCENNELFLVFEYMNENLYEMMKRRCFIKYYLNQMRLIRSLNEPHLHVYR